MTVHVVTNNIESGWDCVSGVFYTLKDAEDYIIEDNLSEDATGEDREEYLDNSMYIITSVEIR
jgi:hypothetical protein